MSEHEKRLRESLGQSMLHHLEILLAEKAEEISRARAEALEEAAGAFDRIQGSLGAKRAAIIIRAMKDSDAPATIPVERVREVLNSGDGSAPPFMHSDEAAGFENGWAAAIRHIEDRLGMELSTKVTCRHCGHAPHQGICNPMDGCWCEP